MIIHTINPPEFQKTSRLFVCTMQQSGFAVSALRGINETYRLHLGLAAVNLFAPNPCFAHSFKVGDSVLCRPSGSEWCSGQVTGTVNGGYKVLVDGHAYVVPDDEHSGSSRIKPGGGDVAGVDVGGGGGGVATTANRPEGRQTEGTVRGWFDLPR